MENKLLILDCDGVLCPHYKFFNQDAKVLSKAFSDKDRTAIKLFKARGWQIIMLSGDTNINQKYAEYCQIDFYCSRQQGGKLDKLRFFDLFQELYDVKPENMIFVGDDPVFDRPLMLKIIADNGAAWTPADASINDIPRTQAAGGQGVVWELYKIYFGPNYDIGDFNS